MKVSLPFMKTEISRRSDFEFEDLVSHILGICNEDFIPTRRSRDGGVDGIRYISRSEMEAYTVYGPVKMNWNERGKKKVDDDAKKIKKILEENQNIKSIKWIFIINTELSFDQIQYVVSKFENPIHTKIITPSKLVDMIALKDEYVMAVGRYLGLLEYNIPVEDLSIYEALREIIKQIMDLERLENNESKILLLDQIINGIIKIANSKIEEFSIVYPTHKEFSTERKLLLGTRIPSKRRKHFVYSNGTFRELSYKTIEERFHINRDELRKTHFFDEVNKIIVYTPNNFLSLFAMCKYLKGTINNSDKPINFILEEYMKSSAERDQKIWGYLNEKWKNRQKKIN